MTTVMRMSGLNQLLQTGWNTLSSGLLIPNHYSENIGVGEVRSEHVAARKKRPSEDRRPWWNS